MDYLLYHPFVIFQTNQDKYWSIERWSTFVSRCSKQNIKTFSTFYCGNETLGQQTGSLRSEFTNRLAVMVFIWKRDKINEF
jgi:hypothetical protein